jgi:hypothetical protein
VPPRRVPLPAATTTAAANGCGAAEATSRR